MSNLITRYHHRISELGFAADPAQLRALERLEGLCALPDSAPRSGAGKGILRRLMRNRTRAPASSAPVGFYLFGGVGRGKTFVIDLCHEHLPAAQRWRVHFHSFMQWVHATLRAAGDVANPLEEVGRAVRARCRVLFLDEFHVGDITDAMLLAGLLEVLAREEVVLVTTSNDVPESLYAGGLQRERFLPAIRFIRERFVLVPFDGEVDYRLTKLTAAPVYHLTGVGDAKADSVHGGVVDDAAGARGVVRHSGVEAALAAIFERLSAGSELSAGVAAHAALAAVAQDPGARAAAGVDARDDARDDARTTGADHKRVADAAVLGAAPALDCDAASQAVGVSSDSEHPEALEIDGRTLPAKRVGPHLAWFEFSTLCEGPRSARDYIELARRFEVVVVSDVPVFDGLSDDSARRFMTMVDEFYDRGVKLILSAAAEPEDLYRGERLAGSFQRTVSRLIEMRTETYLHRPHLS